MPNAQPPGDDQCAASQFHGLADAWRAKDPPKGKVGCYMLDDARCQQQRSLCTAPSETKKLDQKGRTVMIMNAMA